MLEIGTEDHPCQQDIPGKSVHLMTVDSPLTHLPVELSVNSKNSNLKYRKI